MPTAEAFFVVEIASFLLNGLPTHQAKNQGCRQSIIFVPVKSQNMKTVILYSALFLGLTLSIFGCKKETPDMLLIKNWKLTEWVTVPKMQMSDSLKADLMKSATMEFTKDRKFIFKGMSPRPLTGNYSISPTGKSVIFSPESGTATYEHQIEKLTKDSLVLIDVEGNKLVCIPHGK